MDLSIKFFAVFVMILAFVQASSGDSAHNINSLPEGPLLTVHCKSKDGDLGFK